MSFGRFGSRDDFVFVYLAFGGIGVSTALSGRGVDVCKCMVFFCTCKLFCDFLFHGEFFWGLLVLLVPLLECLAGFCVAFL